MFGYPFEDWKHQNDFFFVSSKDPDEMPHFIRVSTVCQDKSIFREINIIFYKNYKMGPFNIWSGPPQVDFIKQEERPHWYTKGLCCLSYFNKRSFFEKNNGLI